MKSCLLPAVIAASLCPSAFAAISILIEPDSSGGTVFSFSQTAPNPTLNVSGISGYALGIDLPFGMFHPDVYRDSSSIISGDFPSPLGTVTEVFSGRSFLIAGLFIQPSEPAGAVLTFDPIHLIGGVSSVRFELSGEPGAATAISPDALIPGVHTVNSTLFGTVTVTVVPEPSLAIYLTAALLPFVLRRRTA